MKKFLLFLTTLLCSLNGWAEFDYEGLKYELKSFDDGKTYYAVVVGVADGNNPTSVTIPSKLTRKLLSKTLVYDVCGVEENAFSSKDIISVTFPESDNFKYINNNAFYRCTYLASITIPSRIEKITSNNNEGLHKNAFNGCRNLETVTIKNSSVIGKDYTESENKISTVFPWVKKVYFSDDITKIGKYAFYKCEYLESVDLNNVTEVGENAFTGCINLKEMDLKNLKNDKNIDHVGLETIRISTTNTVKVSSYNVKHIIFGKDISTFKYGFFDYTNDSEIVSVTFENEDGVDIPERGFGYDSYGCHFGKLKTVNGKIKTIGEKGFAMLTDKKGQLTSIDLSSTTKIGHCAFENQAALQSINLQNVKTIGKYSFENCNKLSSIGVAYSWKVESVGDYAFKGTVLSNNEIAFPECKTIGEGAFNGVKFQNVYLDSKCQTVGDNAFANNSSLKTIIVYGDISESAFQNCPKLETVSIFSDFVANPSKEYTAESNISRYFGTGVTTFKFYTESVASLALVMYPSVTTLYFGDKVASVGESFATFCPELTTVTFSKKYGGVDVGGTAFAFCPKLATVSGQFSDLGIGAFAYCTSLKDVDFKWYNAFLSNDAFYGCSSLVTIKNASIRKIGDRAFKDCSTFTGEGMSFASDITTIGESAFENCVSLKTMPNFPAVENVGNKAFMGCKNMNVYMENLPKVKTIGAQAFMNCGALSNSSGYGGSKTTIPNTIESIGDYAFKGVYPSTLQLSGDNLKYLGKEAFERVYLLEINCPSYLAQDFTTDNNILSSVKFRPDPESLIIGNDVTAIGNNAFNNTSDPIEFSYVITLDTRKLTSLGTDCFKGLKTRFFYISPSSAEISSNAIKVQAQSLWVNGSNLKSDYTSSDNLFHAFSDSLETVNITNESDDMASIPNYAFYTTEGNKTNLKSINGYYSRVGDYAFTNNQNLKSANFELLETIGDDAFANCSGLETVDISDDNAKNPVSIGEYAFKGNSLKMITIHRGKIASGARGDATCNEISVASTAFEGQKPWLLMDMSDQVNVECNENTKVITNTEAKANEYRNRATNAPKYVTSIQRMECKPADVNMSGGQPNAQDVQSVYDAMRVK